MQRQRGFTLIEIAIVLVIIGLLLGGILKGQELITSARVRNLISQMDGIKGAYFAFQDRYRALPGDYPGAQAFVNIPGLANNTIGGNGNGVIDDTAASTESVLAWTHLSHAGFITGQYDAANATPAPAANTNPTNAFNGFVQIIFDANYSDANNAPTARPNLKTGNQVPVGILAEIDRKIDDGDPLKGILRFTTYVAPGGVAPSAATCLANNQWNSVGGDANCGAAYLF